MLPERLFCQGCGSPDYYTKEQGQQIGAYCSSCHKWIKWLPQGKPKFHFGKHKGEFVHEVTNLGYLIWLRDSDIKKSASLRNAVTARISELEYLLK